MGTITDGLFGRLSTEEDNTTVSTEGVNGDSVDASIVADAQIAASEANDIIVSIEGDITAMRQAEVALKQVKAKIDTEEAMLKKPESINSNVVALSYESIENTANLLGLTLDEAIGCTPSIEAIQDNPVSALQLSTEGVKEFFKTIIDGIKKIFAKISLAIKKLVIKLTVMMNGTEKAAVALKEKVNKSSKDGEDIKEADKKKVASAIACDFIETEKYNVKDHINILGNLPANDVIDSLIDGIKLHYLTDTEITKDGHLSVSDKLAASKKVVDKLKLGITTSGKDDEYAHIPVRYDGKSMKGIIIETKSDDSNDKDEYKFKFKYATFKATVPVSVIEALSDSVKQISKGEVVSLLDTVIKTSGKMKGFSDKSIKNSDEFSTQLDAVQKLVEDESNEKSSREIYKSILSAIKTLGSSGVLDSILNYVGHCKQGLNVAKVQAGKYL